MSHPHPELGAPPPLPPHGLRVIPLGGLGEVGRNMAVLEYDGRLLIIDCGVLFPDENQPGVDLILPDFEPIRDRLDDIEAVVLTHGHEDHIGAVPYLLRERPDIPLVGSKLTLALLEAKLREHRQTRAPKHEVKEGERVTFGPFDLEFVAVNHSIPDALAVAVRTGAGMLLHTGDFKMDQLPLDGRITDLRAFARLGEEGVDLFLVDSTNAEVPGFTTAERDIGPVLERVFHKSTQRIIVACFASHVHRVQQVMDAAVSQGRKVAYVGRSMVRNMAIARDLGYLRVPPDTLVDMRELGEYAPERGRDHLDRVAGRAAVGAGPDRAPQPRPDPHRARRHGRARVEPDPRQRELRLPGHQRPDPARRERRPQVQCAWCTSPATPAPASCSTATTSLRPRNVMPVHGEVRHLVANARAGPSTPASPADRVVLAEDGFVVDLVDGVARVTGKVDCGYVFVDGSSVGDITESELKDRRILGDEGFITVMVVMDSVDRQACGRARDPRPRLRRGRRASSTRCGR